jgi:hypothetical protein
MLVASGQGGESSVQLLQVDKLALLNETSGDVRGLKSIGNRIFVYMELVMDRRQNGKGNRQAMPERIPMSYCQSPIDINRLRRV